MKTGLVLSGGGSLGAYEAGAIKALSELGVNVSAIAGTSIGALNGAVLASAHDFATGSAKLAELWHNLAESDIFKANISGLFTLLASLGMPLSYLGQISGEMFPAAGIYSSEPIKKLLKNVINPQNFYNGPQFYVGVTNAGKWSALNFLTTLAGISNTDDPAWLHIQKLPVTERLKAIMASAAIPVIFSPQRIGDNFYMDGGIADWWGDTGNTPLKPLADSECSLIFTILLNKSSLFNRLNYNTIPTIELRPQKDAYCNPSLKSIISFDKKRILQAIKDGYEDCMEKMQKIRNALNLHINKEEAFKNMEISIRELDKSRKDMQNVMEKLRNKKIFF